MGKAMRIKSLTSGISNFFLNLKFLLKIHDNKKITIKLETVTIINLLPLNKKSVVKPFGSTNFKM